MDARSRGRWAWNDDEESLASKESVYCAFCCDLVDIAQYDQNGGEVDPGWLHGHYDTCINCCTVGCPDCVKKECVWIGCRGLFEDGKRVPCESSDGDMWCWDCSQELESVERCSVCAEKVLCEVCAEDEGARVRCAWCGTGHIADLRIRGVSCAMSEDEMRKLRRPKETGFHLLCGQCADVERPEFAFDCACLAEKFASEGAAYRDDLARAVPIQQQRANPSSKSKWPPLLSDPSSAIWIEIARFCDARAVKHLRVVCVTFRFRYWDFAHHIMANDRTNLATKQQISGHRRFFRLLRDLGSNDAKRLLSALATANPSLPTSKTPKKRLRKGVRAVTLPKAVRAVTRQGLFVEVNRPDWWRAFLD